jgi:dTDP-glucose 4,6-dehydratase
MRILVTGGSGFIGSHLLNLLVPAHPEHTFVNVDILTYAADIRRIQPDVREQVTLEVVDITDRNGISAVFERHQPQAVIHLAAETHVDRSIENPPYGPHQFLNTNIFGTFNLLDACRRHWTKGEGRFLHVSTDEVYGSLAPDAPLSSEGDVHHPSSPYAASKSAADGIVGAYHRTYGVPTLITHGANTYGSGQDPEKLIPKFITRSLKGESLPVYGDGTDIRDWIHTKDHVEGIWSVFENGRAGETYNIPGNNPLKNNELIYRLLKAVAKISDRSVGELYKLLIHTVSRLGADSRYGMDGTKMKEQLGWEPQQNFEERLAELVEWHLVHPPVLK